MITREVFAKVWASLCARFGRENDARQAAAYLEYLDGQLSTEELQVAGRALWATSRFFPRPADFLLVGAAGEWRLVLECMEGHRGPDWPWSKVWPRLGQRAKDACNALGGVGALRAAFERDPIRTKEAWEAAYEQATVGDALKLPPPAPPARQLRAAR